MNTLGWSLALDFTIGLQTISGPAQVKKRFVTSWGKTEVFVSWTTPWDIVTEKAWQHKIPWSLTFEHGHIVSYGLRLENRNRVSYGELRQHRKMLRSNYSDQHIIQRRLLLPYSDLNRCRTQCVFSYWLTQALAVNHALPYAITDVNFTPKKLMLPWALLDDAHLQAVVNNPELVWHSHKIQLLNATLSCDEGSPVWIASIEIAALQDFAQIAIGDLLTLTLGLEIFVLMVDGKTLSRESQSDHRYDISAVSPVAKLDAPFASKVQLYHAEPISAQIAVSHLLGAVNWQLPSWTIPPGRLMLQGVTPLSAARHIVGAIGGIVDSQPDGSIVCRRRHPVSIPHYGQATVDHVLTDGDIISSRAQIAPARGFNRVTIANENSQSSATTDRIEYVAENPQEGWVRAYLSVVRPVHLVHTGHPSTAIKMQGEIVRHEIEVLEFIEGSASTRYPVTRIVQAAWQHTDLGSLRFEGQLLTASVPGYSLLKLTYSVLSLNWSVKLAADEDVQFVLVEM